MGYAGTCFCVADIQLEISKLPNRKQPCIMISADRGATFQIVGYLKDERRASELIDKLKFMLNKTYEYGQSDSDKQI